MVDHHMIFFEKHHTDLRADALLKVGFFDFFRPFFWFEV
jgi:hypothetical protein